MNPKSQKNFWDLFYVKKIFISRTVISRKKNLEGYTQKLCRSRDKDKLLLYIRIVITISKARTLIDEKKYHYAILCASHPHI